MPEEGVRGQLLLFPFSKGGEGGKRCPAQILIFIVVTSLFAPACFPRLKKCTETLLLQYRKETKCFFVKNCAFVDFHIFIFNRLMLQAIF